MPDGIPELTRLSDSLQGWSATPDDLELKRLSECAVAFLVRIARKDHLTHGFRALLSGDELATSLLIADTSDRPRTGSADHPQVNGGLTVDSVFFGTISNPRDD